MYQMIGSVLHIVCEGLIPVCVCMCVCMCVCNIIHNYWRKKNMACATNASVQSQKEAELESKGGNVL